MTRTVRSLNLEFALSYFHYIKKFYGLSPHAVKTQIWIAISVYVLLAIVRKRLRLEVKLFPISQILSLALFEKSPLLQAFSQISSSDDQETPCNQLNLFDLSPDSFDD